MLLSGVPFIAVVMYVGLIVGTHKKIAQNGIRLIGKSKSIYLIAPLAIFIIHFVWAVINLTKDAKYSMHILKLVIFEYPLVLGLMIEVFLETFAYKLSENEQIVKSKKKKYRNKVVRKSKNLDIIKDNERARIFFKEYRKVLHAPSA